MLTTRGRGYWSSRAGDHIRDDCHGARTNGDAQERKLNCLAVDADRPDVSMTHDYIAAVPPRVSRWNIVRVDPILAIIIVALCAVGGWIAAPMAAGAGETTSANALIDLKVPVTTAVLPGWQPGNTSVTMPSLSIPGEAKDAQSAGWVMSTNWENGYEVRIRSTTSPAMRGANAVDGRGASDSMQDFSTSTACPCPWSGSGYSKAVFGYSASVVASSGPPAQDTSQWGNTTNRRWRGLDDASYRLYSTPGGEGQYRMTLYFRSMIPDGATQSTGSYRTTAIVSVHPIFASGI